MSAGYFMSYFAGFLLAASLLITPTQLAAQQQSSDKEIQELRAMVLDLQSRVVVLEQQNSELRSRVAPDGAGGPEAAVALESAATDIRGSAAAQPVVRQVVASSPSGAAQVASIL